MGGLVIAKAVTIAEKGQDVSTAIFPSIAGCIFFGTPFAGAPAAALASTIASIGEKFDRTVASSLLNLMKPGDESLRELTSEFVRLATNKLSQDIQLYCFYEEQETNFARLKGLPANLGKLIPKSISQFVSRESSTLNGVNEMGLACCHRDLVKFDSFEDERYELIQGPLKRIIDGAQLVTQNRFNATRGLNHQMVQDVQDALEGCEVRHRRKELGEKYSIISSAWLTEEQEYTDWKSVSPVQSSMASQCLWIRGPKGRGKTSNMLAVLKNIESMIESEKKSSAGQAAAPLLAYFFCEPPNESFTVTDLLKTLLWQLIKQQPTLAWHAKHFAKKKGKEEASRSTRLTVDNLWQSLQDMLSDELTGRTVFLVINNVHALPEDVESTTTLARLINNDLVQSSQRRVSVRWLITSRLNETVRKALTSPKVCLIDLENDQYGDQVQLELRKHAQAKVSLLREKKHYNKALSYFASSVIGRRAENIQWIDIACVHLDEISPNEQELKIRQTLESMPRDLSSLLDQAWAQVLVANPQHGEKIKEMLRALVLLYEDPTEEELAVLTGFTFRNQDGTYEVRSLVEKCKPLLMIPERAGTNDSTVSFLDSAVKDHLKDSTILLGLNEDKVKLHHGVLAYRALTHIMEHLSYPQDGNGGGFDSDEDADTDTDEDSDAGSDDISDDSDDDSDDIEQSMDTEAQMAEGKALAYMVKYWLDHASEATAEIADDLSLEPIWGPDSPVRRRWVIEYHRLTQYWDGFDLDRKMTPLHIAASVGFVPLVAALLRNGHKDELNLRDDSQNTPVSSVLRSNCCFDS